MSAQTPPTSRAAEAAIHNAAEVLYRDYASQYQADHLSWRDFADLAREALTAAGAIGAYDPNHEPGLSECGCRMCNPQPAPELAAAMAALQRDLADAEAEIGRWPRCPAGCRCRVGTGDADALECGCDGPCATGWDAPKPAPAIGTEHGPVALRPALSATVVIAAPDPVGDGPRATMTAAFAQDGLRTVFVENAAAIGELPPDPALRADLRAMTARWDDQAATHSRDADKTRNDIAAAALWAKARIYDANAGEVRELLGEENTGA